MKCLPTSAELQLQKSFIQFKKLVRAHVMIGNKMLLIDRRRLRKFMADSDIKCDVCGDDSCGPGASGSGRDDRGSGYVARAAISNVSVTSLSSEVKLWYGLHHTGSAGCMYGP